MTEMTKHPGQPLRVLFLCMHNSSRSQMAEGLLQTRGGSAFDQLYAAARAEGELL